MDQGGYNFGKYAFSPNKLKLCGPSSKNRTIFNYLINKKSDQGLIDCLKEFEAAFPYISFIAKENRIKDPFEKEVVKAYWVGNSLLNNVKSASFYRFIKDKFKGYLDYNQLREIKEKIKEGGKPHHNFHVLEIFPKTGGMSGAFKFSPSLIDNCLISWGKIKEVGRDKVKVERRPVVLGKDKLTLGEKIVEDKDYSVEDESFIDPVEKGDMVSVHWGFLCEVLEKEELIRLKYWTKKFLNSKKRG